ncbi:prophage tail fiber N-terminal domain-containing protein, partial [Escherichia coli]
MSVLISGALINGAGVPMAECKIYLDALVNTSEVVTESFAVIETDAAGQYAFEAQKGKYTVHIKQKNGPKCCVGDISVYDDSKPGTLNDFLTALDEGDLKPDVVKRFEELVAQAQQSAEAAAESERQAGQHAADAQKIKEDCQALADEVQQNAGAVAEDRQRTEQLASETEKIAAQVKKDAASAENAAAGAEQAKNEIDTALAATLKTANHLSEIAAEGEEAQQASRDHLGLKSAATMEPQSDIRDRTEGRLAIPGASGFGHIFLPGEVIRFDTEKDLLAWVKRATPGEYSVQGANGVLPGGYCGVINIRFLEANRYPPEPQYMAKAITWYGINGHVYYNRYWSSGNGCLTGWENLKTDEEYFHNLIRARAPLDSPAFTGKPETPTPPDDAAGNEIANAEFVRKLLAALVDSSPEALDTLNELAAALGNDPEFATTVTNALAGKQPLNAVLTALSNLTQRADTFVYFNADEDVSLAPLSEKGRSLLAQETPENMRTELELKSAATMEPQSDIRDRTEGRLAIPGAFGFGHIFLPGEAVRFNSEADFLAWARYAEPGEYFVDAANRVLPGGNAGMISIRWLEAGHNPPLPVYTAKAIIFYGTNGQIYYNRYWSTGNGYLIGWENLKLNETELWNAILSKAPLNSPAFTGTPTTPTPPDDATGLEMANAAFVRKLLAALVDSSPEALDTLNELAAALGNDPEFATTVTNALAGKQPLSDVLTAISKLTQRAGTLPYFDDDENVSLTPLSEKARSLLAQDTPEAMRTALELKAAATMTPQETVHDRTEGRLAIPGAFGFGHIFTPSELIRFKTEADFLEWVRNATPGEYYVEGANSMSSTLPGVVFLGII